MNQHRPDAPRPEAVAADGVAVRDFYPDMPDDPATFSFEPHQIASQTAVKHLTYDNGRVMRSIRARRQGRDVLGPHAFEDQMHLWQKHLIRHQSGAFKTIQYGTEPEITLIIMNNESYKTISALQMLSGADPNVRNFSYCHPATNHYHKQSFLRGFCGYHSIKTMLSFLRGDSTAPKHHVYAVRIPNILEIQDLIEEGWTHKINSHARIETGGVRGTRKYIGTSEAETVFRLLNICCWTMRLQSRRGVRACDLLMDRVGRYFARKHIDNPLGPAPIYLQFHGHSMVIVGFETWRKRTGTINGHIIHLPHLGELVVFNCSVPAQKAVEQIRDGRVTREELKKYGSVLDRYRFSRYELEKYGAFELIYLEDPRLWL